MSSSTAATSMTNKFAVRSESACEPRQSAANVLLLDDEPSVRDSLQYLLEAEQYTVQSFATPEQFLSARELPRPACLILDLTMPGMSGLEVLRLISQRRPRIPTVVLTGFADVSATVAAMRLGAIHLLEKPCSDGELLNAVHEAIDKATALEEQHQQHTELETKLARLTPRERELVDMFVEGLDPKIVAERLGTSPNTVRNQRASLLEKMEAESVADLVRMVLAARE